MSRHLCVAIVLASFVACALSVPACEIEPPALELTATVTEPAPTEPATTIYPGSTASPSVASTPQVISVSTPASTSTAAAVDTVTDVPTPTGASGGGPSLTISPSNPDDTTPRKASWKDHPMYRANPDSVVLPILAWYTTRSSKDYEWTVSANGRYTRQGSRYNLIARDISDTPEAKKYHNYDLLSLSTYGYEGLDNWLEFELTRGARMCVVMGVDDDSADLSHDSVMAGPPGFESIGMARWDEDSEKPVNHRFSTFTSNPISWSYMVCKDMAAGTHKLPSVDVFGAQYKLWGYNLLFSELDGSIPPDRKSVV